MKKPNYLRSDGAILAAILLSVAAVVLWRIFA
jgi:hypothetical protein